MGGIFQRGRLRPVLLRVALVTLLALATSTLPQAASAYTPLQPPPPTEDPVDPVSVNVWNGSYSFTTRELAIGDPDAGGLVYERTWFGTGWRDNLTGTINSASGVYTVSFGSTSETFTLSGGVFTQDQGRGSTLAFNSGTQVYTYTAADGSIALFSKSLAGTLPTDANEGRITSIRRPTGEKLTYTYSEVTVCMGSPCANTKVARLQSVQTNLGYQLRLSYALNSAAPTAAQVPDWINITKASGVDLGTLYCDPAADSCAGIPSSWPSATYGLVSGNPLIQTVTDQMGRVTRYTLNAGSRMTGIKRPSSASDNITITYDANNQVATVSDGAGTWTYTYEATMLGMRTVVVDSTGRQRTTRTNLAGLLAAVGPTALIAETTKFYYDSFGRRTKVTQPEGDYTEFTYDARGNVTQTRHVPKAGTGPSDILTYASYDATCANPVKCNQPNSTTDERGFVTDYTYDTTHGGMLTVTRPAPTTGAVRPQTRYGYSSLYAWYKNSAGTVVQGPAAVVRLTSTSACTTSATCANTAQEVETTIGYGPTGVANHLLPATVTSGSGDGVLAATASATYDEVGNLLTGDGPLAGTADTWRYRYNDDRELVGVVSPDPDGAGPLKNRAVRTTYNADGRATLVERGTVLSQSDPDWANFVSLEQQAIAYNAQGRKVKDTLVTSGVTRAAVQYSYDLGGRPDCTALRMNTATFGALPASACTLATTGTNGPDRITKNTYDSWGRLTKVTAGYATASARDEQTATYSNNSQVLTLADAKGSLTTYQYDDFDRLWKTFYPSPTTPGTSSTTDYEQYTYDAASNVTQDRRRDATTVTFGYDNLSRQTSGLLGATYAYDNLDRVTSATRSGQTTTLAWDALGRQTSEAGPLGTVTFQYDLADRRTRLTWPDTFYVTYDYLLTDEMTAVRENGAASGIGVLATFAYDDLGRRTGLTRGNGATTTYGFDAASRLNSLVNELGGTTADVTLGFTYNAAGQVLTRASSNTAYAPPMPAPAKTYTTNGLNQYTVVSGTSLTYDPRGNLTNDGTRTYGYDIANRLTSAGTGTYGYDVAGRLAQQTIGGVTTKFAYDGVDLIAEYSSAGALQRRYVHGPAFDEPLVWYEGSGTTDRRWLVADQLGSVIAVTDAAGAATAINTYDEYGRPGANTGRFQYTGQTWLSDAGLYHYKARAYHPTLGRFMQSDPIGYDDGMNMYAYVRNDPVNRADPTGLCGTANDPCPIDELEVIGDPCAPIGSCLAAVPTLTYQFVFLEKVVAISAGGGGKQCAAVVTTWPVPGHTNLNKRDPSRGQGDGGFGSPRSRGSHTGIDINAPVGAPVVAAARGQVFNIQPNPSATYGRQVVIDHGSGIYSQYAHLDKIMVLPGVQVSAGTQIGTVGTSGNTPAAADPHLHFEIRVGSPLPRTAGGTVVNPATCYSGAG